MNQIKFNNFITRVFIAISLIMGYSVVSYAAGGDTCADAIVAKLSPDITGHVSGTNPDDWYVYTATADGELTITYTSNDQTDVYADTNPCATTNFVNNAKSGSKTIAMNSGQTVSIHVAYKKVSDYTIQLKYGGYDFANSNFRDYLKININGEVNTNIKGDMTIIGNSQLGCRQYDSDPSTWGTSWTDCNGAAPDGVPNNDIRTQYNDFDGDSSTVNSTSSDITTAMVPADAKVIWAGLYWQGRVPTNFTTVQKEAFATVKLKKDSGAYMSVTADTFNWIVGGNGTDLQGFADITDRIDVSNIHGTYWVADLMTDVGTDNTRNRYGAWAIVFVYESNSKPYKNISIYDGYEGLYVTPDEAHGIFSSITKNLSGFYTPIAGDIDSTFFVFAGEGDFAYGDGLVLDGTNVTSTYNPAGNQINSTVTNFGSQVTTRNPSYTNTIGIDIDTYNVGTVGAGHLNIITNGQSSANVTVMSVNTLSGADTFFPAVFAFSTELYVPKVCYKEEVYAVDNAGVYTSVSGGAGVDKGSTLVAKVYVHNEGNETAESVSVNREVGQETILPYKAGSTFYNSSTNNSYYNGYPFTGTLTQGTDVVDTDNFSFDAGVFNLNIGVGSDSAVGGDLYSTSSGNANTAYFEFSALLKSEDNVSFEYVASFKNEALGITFNDYKLPKCEDFNNSFWGRGTTSSFVSAIDVVDVDEYATYATDPVIKTKITEQPNVTLQAVYLDPATGAETIYHDSIYNGNAPIQALLYRSTDSSCSDELPLAMPVTGSPAGQPVIATIVDGESAGTTNSFTMEANASSTTYIKIVYADWNNILNGLENASSCFNNANTAANFEGLPQCLNNLGSNAGISQDLIDAYPSISTTCLDVNNIYGGHNACDSSAYDNQGSVGDIQPEKYNNAYGCFACILDALTDNTTCSKDGFAIRPQKLVINSTTSSAPYYPDLLRAGKDYDLTIDAVNYASSTNTVGYNQTYGNLDLTHLIKYYANGTTEANASLLPGTAAWGAEFNITDGYTTIGGVAGVAPYTYSEVGDITIHIEDATFAAIDNDDTPQTCDANGTKVCGDQNATFIPDHFDVSASLVNRAGGNTFTYLSSDLNMSARYNVTITAKNADGDTTTNFRQGALYYENPVSVHVTAPAVTGVGAAVVHDVDPAALLGFVLGVGGVTWNDTNESLQLSFNYPRTTNTPVNPFRIDGNETTVDVNSTYVGGAPIGTAEVNGTDLADANVTFVYGRSHMARTRAMCSGSPCTGNVTFYYEFYGDKDANKTLITALLTPDSPKRSIDTVNWYQNTKHVTGNGDGNVTSASFNIPPNLISGSYQPVYTQYTSNTSAALKYDGTKGFPYKATIELSSPTNTQSWLIYDKYNVATPRNSGQLEYYGPGSWSSNTGAEETVKDSGTTNRNENTNRRIRW